MIDYVEGLLEIRQRLKATEEALLKKRPREARLLLADIERLAAETNVQVIKQFQER